MAKKSESVPKAMQEKFDRVVAITDEFAKQHLNDEYAQMIRAATAALCRKRPSPLAKGQDKTWACGITHAIGMVNFLFDPSQSPHISAKDLYEKFGVSSSSGQSKSKAVRDALGMHQFDPDWCTPSNLDANPLAWMISVNGFLMDARSAPREVQEIALAQGLIPYIPGDEEPEQGVAEEEVQKAPKGKSKKAASTSPEALYRLDVFIIGGPVEDEFMEANPVVCRTIEIKGSNTLAELHKIIFEAFDREEEHMYEFQIGGRGPHDPNACRYGLKQLFTGSDKESMGDASKTTIASLGLSVEDVLGYWFDFGDDWWHQIDVMAISDKAPPGKYPKITGRIGDSPPQYPDFG